MACQIEEAIKVVNTNEAMSYDVAQVLAGGKPIAYNLYDLEDEGIVTINFDETLGSSEEVVTQLGDRGKGNDTAYVQLQRAKQAEVDRINHNIGKADATYKQTIKVAYIKGGQVWVSFQKGPDRQVMVTLGSKESDKLPYTADDLKVNALKSVEGMKAIVEEMNDPTVSEEYKSYILGLLDMVDPKFITQKELYINTKADKNAGIIDDQTIIITTTPDKLTTQNDMSATEVYAHEVMHAITKFAIENTKNDIETNRLVRQLEVLRKRASKVIKVKDLLPTLGSTNKEEWKIARARYKYMFESKNGLHEFLAHGMTNPKVMEKLKKTKGDAKAKDTSLFHSIVKFVRQLLDIVQGNVEWKNIGKNDHEKLMNLTFELMQSNNKAVNYQSKKKAQSSTIAEALLNVGNEALAKGIQKAVDYLDAEGEKVPQPPRNASKITQGIFLARYIRELATRADLAGMREVVMTVFGMAPEGLIQNIIRDFSDPDVLERNIEYLEMSSSSVDRVRMLVSSEVEAQLKRDFGYDVTTETQQALTETILDTDLSAITTNYKTPSIAKLMSNPEFLASKVKLVKTQLARMDRKNANWHLAQAQGLGFYLANHTAGIAQNLNAYNIAAGVLTQKRRIPSDELVAKIDELSTLIALEVTSQASKDLTVEFISKSPKGFKAIVDLQVGLKKSTKENLFDDETHIIKGYTKELFDDTVSIEVSPLSEDDVMREKGFELVQVLDKDPYDTSTVKYGLYKKKSYVNNSWNRGATRMTGQHRKGTSLTDLARKSGDSLAVRAAERDIKKLDKKRREVVKEMQAGTYRANNEEKLSPILNPDGEVVNYRYMMSKVGKKLLLEQDTDVTTVLGRSLGSVRDKMHTQEQNEAVLEVILQDQRKNWDPDGPVVFNGRTGKNGKLYLKIEANSRHKAVAEIYNILPTQMKQAIKDSNDGYIAVRQDMLHNYFGFRAWSMANIIPNAWKSDSEFVAFIARAIQTAELVWQELMAITKVDIIVRTPAVFIGNFVSNLMYSIINGENPLKVMKLQLENIRNTKSYLEVQQEIEKLTIGALSGKVNNDKKIEELQGKLKKNPVSDLMDAGMYQAIIEDISMKDLKSTNKVSKFIGDKTKSLPEFVKNGAKWMYLSEGTSYFNLVTTATQYSDFIARATEYQLLQRRMEKSQVTYDTLSDEVKKGLFKNDSKLHKSEARVSAKHRKQIALNQVLDAFINYGKPASSFEEYLNDMGMFMFTKYLKRIQRAIRTSIKTKPLNVFLSVLGQELFLDVSDIQENSVFVRGVIPFNQSFADSFQQVITPTALEAVGIL